MKMIEQRQDWHDLTRYLLMSNGGSVQLELFHEPQGRFGYTAYIYGLWVNKPRRRRGSATLLLNRAEEIARQAGHQAVFLTWDRKDTPLEILSWYMNRGYNQIAYAPPSHDSLLLKKQL